MMPKLPTIAQAYQILDQEQRHQSLSKLHDSILESLAFNADKKPSYERAGAFVPISSSHRPINLKFLAPNVPVSIIVIIVKLMVIVLNDVGRYMVIHLITRPIPGEGQMLLLILLKGNLTFLMIFLLLPNLLPDSINIS